MKGDMENRAVSVLSSDNALFQWQELLFSFHIHNGG